MKYPSGKSNLPLKLFPATVANADIDSLKSLHTLFGKHLDHMLVKFEQNVWSKLHEILSFLTKKNPGFFFKPFLTKRWRHFGRRFCG